VVQAAVRGHLNLARIKRNYSNALTPYRNLYDHPPFVSNYAMKSSAAFSPPASDLHHADLGHLRLNRSLHHGAPAAPVEPVPPPPAKRTRHRQFHLLIQIVVIAE